MRVHAGLILFIGAMLLSVLVVGVFTSVHGDTSSTGSVASASALQAEISSVSVYGVAGNEAEYVTIEVRGGDEPLRVDDLVVTLGTSSQVTYTVS